MYARNPFIVRRHTSFNPHAPHTHLAIGNDEQVLVAALPVVEQRMQTTYSTSLPPRPTTHCSTQPAQQRHRWQQLPALWCGRTRQHSHGLGPPHVKGLTQAGRCNTAQRTHHIAQASPSKHTPHPWQHLHTPCCSLCTNTHTAHCSRCTFACDTPSCHYRGSPCMHPPHMQ